ncbi:pilus assembly protein N-terminal domain-containing protein [Alphaproteobacteria bacterium]|nr:pilus assembly protein N-terminal domain-containing protein [Alphaproteobacteria bacterium]
MPSSLKTILSILIIGFTSSNLALAEETTAEQLAQNSMQNSSSGTYIDIVPAPSVTQNEYPVSIDEPTHPDLRLSPDKSELVVLDQAAATVIVGNPNHLSVLPSTSQGLILVGKLPGATHFIALNEEGKVIMQRHVLVAAPKENYVRIRKTCAASTDDNCQSTQVYYCPDTCHEIVIGTESNAGEGEESAQAAAEGASGMNNNAPAPDQDSATE